MRKKDLVSVTGLAQWCTATPSVMLFEYEYEDRFLEKIRVANLEKSISGPAADTDHCLCMNHVNASIQLKKEFKSPYSTWLP